MEDLEQSRHDTRCYLMFSRDIFQTLRDGEERTMMDDLAMKVMIVYDGLRLQDWSFAGHLLGLTIDDPIHASIITAAQYYYYYCKNHGY